MLSLKTKFGDDAGRTKLCKHIQSVLKDPSHLTIPGWEYIANVSGRRAAIMATKRKIAEGTIRK